MHHEASQGESTEEQSFEYAVRIPPAPETPVEQRVAVLDYLIELDGVEVVDPDVRLLGRQGVAIGFAGATPVYPDQFPITLLVDADSAEIFGTGLVSVAESADFGSVHPNRRGRPARKRSSTWHAKPTAKPRLREPFRLPRDLIARVPMRM